MVHGPSVVLSITANPSWISPIVEYLGQGTLPTDPMEARRLVRKASQFALAEGILFRRGINGPMLRCLDPVEAKLALEEVHGGIGSHHVGGKSLARKILRAGYYWPTLQKDAIDHVKRCEKCQFHSDVYQKPSEELHSLSSPYPFYQWGMDLIGPFPTAPGQLKWVVVAIDYFTKWVEAEPLATISSAKVQKFFERQVVARFGVPQVLVTDNGTQFAASAFKDLVNALGIKHYFSSVEHPQTNGQVESVNRSLIQGIKRRLEGAKGNWVENLHEVLWSYRTTIQTSTGETPFRLTYGCDAVIPMEKVIPSFRVIQQPNPMNDTLICEDLVLSEEMRDLAAEREKHAKKMQAKGYNRSVSPREFEVGDLVLRRADIGLKNAKDGKLAKSWEGPYRVTFKSGTGAYKLETLSGAPINNSWNVAKLKGYYS